MGLEGHLMVYILGRKILALALSCFFLTACAGSYTPTQTDSQGNETHMLILGDEAHVADAIYSAILSEFPSDNIQTMGTNQKMFAWRHQPLLDATNYRLAIKKGFGTDQSGKRIEGYFYTINTNGTQGFVEMKYIDPLNDAIRDSLGAAGLKTVSVTALSEISISPQVNPKAAKP
jgi:hypothetical protein